MALENLLLVESDPIGAHIIQSALSRRRPFHVEWVRTLSHAIARLGRGGIDAVALNLFLTDSQGMVTFDALNLSAPQTPILVLCRLQDERLAKQAMQRGAQDYFLSDHGDPFSLTHALDNIIERKTLEDGAAVRRERALITLDSIGDAVLSADEAENVTYLNMAAEEMTGWSRHDAAGRPLSDVFVAVDALTREPSRLPGELIASRSTPRGLTNCILIRRDGHETAIEDSVAPMHDRSGRVTGWAIVFRDVSAWREMSRQIAHLAEHDFLTNLPNRMLLNDRLTQAIAMARRHGNRIGLLFLDLDRFKEINDLRGHVVGDRLLRMVAKRLTTCVRRSDTVSRYGGDEFVVLLPDLDDARDVAVTVTKIFAALSLPYSADDHVFHVPVSIGASVYPEDGEDAETLTKNADAAMYIAKGKGPNNSQIFTPEINVRSTERQFIKGSLHQALERQEMSVHYQPTIRFETGEIVGVEALLRWHHPELGAISPAQFVPIAEESGLMLPIGRWVLREACRQAKAWVDAGLGRIPVAVNVSALEFRNGDFTEEVRETLEDIGLEPGLLELEVTETALVQHADSAAAALQGLKELGVQLAVDDFGTGYASLNHLRDFPVDALKVHQSFVHRISSNPNDAAILTAVINMGNSMRKRVIAEGVETREQLGFLQSHGCEEGQGYYFHRPMEPNQLATLLDARKSRLLG
jgi:diguanylate cyclase (GGDEF)-like protein/PAS domain S-box-containing protein